MDEVAAKRHKLDEISDSVDGSYMYVSDLLCGVDMTERLSDDSLISIFSYLDFHERLNVLLSCKRWQTLIEGSWSRGLSNMDVAAFLRLAAPCSQFGEQSPDLTSRVFEFTLPRFGPYVKHLVFDRCGPIQLTEKQLAYIAEYCTNVGHLSLRRAQLSPEAVLELRKFTHLVSLNVDGCIKSSASEHSLATALCHLTILQLLDVSDTVITGECLLSVSPTLTAIDLRLCANLKQSSLHSFLAAVPNLKTLKITKVSYELLRKSAICCAQLSYLEFRDYVDESVDFSGLTSLEVLILNCCKGFNSVALKSVVESCPNLQNLRLFNTGVGADALPSISCLKRLEELDLGFLPVDDATLAVILESIGEKLRILELYRCKQLTDAAIFSMVNCCRSLTLFDISECTKLTDAGLNYVRMELPKRCPNVSILAPRNRNKYDFPWDSGN